MGIDMKELVIIGEGMLCLLINRAFPDKEQWWIQGGGGGGGSTGVHPPKLWLTMFFVSYFVSECLKPRVRDKRLYGTGTSGLMLISVTHPTQCVAECTKCGFSGQANTTRGPSMDSVGPSPKRSPINMAVRITSEHTYARNARARIRAIHVIGLLHTEIVWHTSQLPHTIWCSPTHPHCHWDWRIGIGCAMAAERWVWANEIHIFPT